MANNQGENWVRPLATANNRAETFAEASNRTKAIAACQYTYSIGRSKTGSASAFAAATFYGICICRGNIPRQILLTIAAAKQEICRSTAAHLHAHAPPRETWGYLCFEAHSVSGRICSVRLLITVLRMNSDSDFEEEEAGARRRESSSLHSALKHACKYI